MTNELLAANAISDTERDENEWRELAKERAATWSQTVYNGTRPKAVACGVKYSDKPHRDSYGADLPMRSQLDTDALARVNVKERKQLQARPIQLTVFGSAEEMQARAESFVADRIVSLLNSPAAAWRSKERKRLEKLTPEERKAYGAAQLRPIMQKRDKVRAVAESIGFILSSSL